MWPRKTRSMETKRRREGRAVTGWSPPPCAQTHGVSPPVHTVNYLLRETQVKFEGFFDNKSVGLVLFPVCSMVLLAARCPISAPSPKQLASTHNPRSLSHLIPALELAQPCGSRPIPAPRSSRPPAGQHEVRDPPGRLFAGKRAPPAGPAVPRHAANARPDARRGSAPGTGRAGEMLGNGGRCALTRPRAVVAIECTCFGLPSLWAGDDL